MIYLNPDFVKYRLMEEGPSQGVTGRPRAEGIPSGQTILWCLYRKVEVG